MTSPHDAVAAHREAAVALRRRMHLHPELGWTEYFATWTVVEELRELRPDRLVIGRALYGDVARLGLPSEEIDTAALADASAAGVPDEFLDQVRGGYTGVVADFDSGTPGPEITVRADIDALAVTEADDTDHRPTVEGFRSVRDGISHACGHDSHTATVLLVARALATLGGPRRGRVRFLFQPAEEGARGADALVKAGWLDRTDVFLSLHNASRDWFQVGDVSEGVHDILATSKIDLHFEGREAHAALAPEHGRSALLAASAVAMLVPSLPRRNSVQTALAVGELHAGTSRNVIPGSAVLRTELRSTSEKEVVLLEERLERLVRGIADALEVGVRIEIVGRASGADSDTALMERVGSAIELVPGTRRVPSMRFDASDDAATMMRRVQERGGVASYLHIGNSFPGATHTPRFDVDETTIALGAEVLVTVIVEAMEDCPPLTKA